MKNIIQSVCWACGIALFIFVGYKGLTWGKRTAGENLFEYDLEALKKVSPNLISHKEIQSIKVIEPDLKAICIGEDDTLYAAAGKTLIKFDSEGKKLDVKKVSEEIQCVAIDADNTLYVGYRSQVVIINSSLNQIRAWDMPSNAYVTSIAIGPEHIYIADAGNKVAYVYDKQGAHLSDIGRKSVKKNSRGIHVPSPFFDVVVDSGNSLWLVNPGYHAFENYTNDGYMIRTWSSTTNQIEGFSGCCNPTHIAVMPNDDFVTSEKGIVRVKIYSSDGTFKSVVAAPEEFSNDTKGLDIAIDSQGKIFIADSKRNCIRVFTRK